MAHGPAGWENLLSGRVGLHWLLHGFAFSTPLSAISINFHIQVQFVMFLCSHPGTPIDPVSCDQR